MFEFSITHLQNLSWILAISIVTNLFFFMLSRFGRTNKLLDTTYAGTFLIINFTALFLNGSYTYTSIILVTLITIWSSRIGVFLFIRILKEQKDSRFDKYENDFWKMLTFWFFQGIVVFIVSLPTTLFIILDNKANNFNVVSVTIFTVFSLIAILFESIADYQKFHWNTNVVTKGTFINKGLWSLSRHPNYFGEISFWISITFLILTSSIGTNYNFVLFFGLLSPFFITFLLYKITGVPILEKQGLKLFGHQKEYFDYINNTPCVVPFFGQKGWKKFQYQKPIEETPQATNWINETKSNLDL